MRTTERAETRFDMAQGHDIAGSGFGQFMASGAGRLLRIVAGIALIAWGLSMDNAGGYVIAAIGAVPLLAGMFDFCVITGLFGGLWSGERVRARARRR